jgi:hypothetical protein
VQGKALLVSCELYEENRFRFSVVRYSGKGAGGGMRKFVPSLIVDGNGMFFVRVNRFWCVWIRALVFERHASGAEELVRVLG